MSDEQTSLSTPSASPTWKRFSELDDPATAHEADTSGPFSLIEEEGMVALYHAWESSGAGGRAAGGLPSPGDGAAVPGDLAGVGPEQPVPSAGRAGGAGVRPGRGGQIVGSLRSFDPGAIVGGHIAAYLARTPLSLALLVEAAGPTAQKHVGRILGARVLGTQPLPTGGGVPHAGAAFAHAWAALPLAGGASAHAGGALALRGELPPTWGSSRPRGGRSRPRWGRSRPSGGGTVPTWGSSGPSGGESRPSVGESRPRVGEQPSPRWGTSPPCGGSSETSAQSALLAL